MGTRSDIIVQRAGGKWARIYCHFDGYLEHNGQILFEHYTTQALVEKLVKPGDMSSLAPRCDKPRGHSYDKRVEGYCVYYGRDRGETGIEAKIGDDLAAVWPDADTDTEFTYVWKRDTGWWTCRPHDPVEALMPLAVALGGPLTKLAWEAERRAHAQPAT